MVANKDKIVPVRAEPRSHWCEGGAGRSALPALVLADRVSCAIASFPFLSHTTILIGIARTSSMHLSSPRMLFVEGAVGVPTSSRRSLICQTRPHVSPRLSRLSNLLVDCNPGDLGQRARSQ